MLKQPFMRSYIARVALVALLAFPLSASADQISDLLAQLKILQAQLEMLQAQTGALQTTPETCLALTFNLGPDDTDAETGGEVSKLQEWLIRQPGTYVGTSIYPEARITGYFGPATMRAVQKWQAKHGLVASGDPDSTGYGYVGRKTRAAMQNCSQGLPSSNAAAIDYYSGIPAISSSELAQGWYWGDYNQKKPGTPSTWLHRAAGTRSAQWYDPAMGATVTTEPTLSVGTITDVSVAVAYTNMPAGTYINLLWLNSSNQYESTVQQSVPSGGSGTAVLNLTGNIPSGYYKAQARKTSDMYWSVDSAQFVIKSPTTALNCTLKASPSYTSAGQYVILSWSSLGASYASWKRDEAATLLKLPTGTLLGDGSVTVAIPYTTASGIIPTLNVYRADGTSGACGTNIYIQEPLPTCTISASEPYASVYPYTLLPVTLTWKSTNADSATISPFINGPNVPGTAFDVPPYGSYVVNPNDTTTYTLLVKGKGGNGSCSVRVNLKG